MKLKVALITNTPAPYRIPLFEKLSNEVDLMVYFNNYTSDREWDVNNNYNFKFKFLDGFKINYISKKEPGFYWINISIFNEILNSDFDVIIVGGYSTFTTQVAFFLSKLRKIPIILWSGNTKYDDNLLRKLTSPFINALTRNSNGFITYGKRAKEYLISQRVDPKRIFIAINVGDLNYFLNTNKELKAKTSFLKKKFHINTNKNILYVGRLTKDKGLEYLINAYNIIKEEMDDIGLILVGNGPLKKVIENEKIKGLYLFDFVQPRDLPKFYAMADVFVIPSFYDRFSIVLSEAMASGLPVIATYKNGASIDLIKNGYNGFIIDKEDHIRFYNKLKILFENPDLLIKMGENSKTLAINELNLDLTVKGFKDAINNVWNDNNSYNRI